MEHTRAVGDEGGLADKMCGAEGFIAATPILQQTCRRIRDPIPRRGTPFGKFDAFTDGGIGGKIQRGAQSSGVDILNGERKTAASIRQHDRKIEQLAKRQRAAQAEKTEIVKGELPAGVGFPLPHLPCKFLLAGNKAGLLRCNAEHLGKRFCLWLEAGADHVHSHGIDYGARSPIVCDQILAT